MDERGGRRLSAEHRARIAESMRLGWASGTREIPIPIPPGQPTSRFRDYGKLHRRLRTKHPKSGTCGFCGTDGPTDWARRPGMPYSEDISHYAEACRRCNMALDRLERDGVLPDPMVESMLVGFVTGA